MTIQKQHTIDSAADEVRAYDLLEKLITAEGITTVLSTLRAWCVLRDLNRPPQRARRAVTAITGYNSPGSI